MTAVHPPEGRAALERLDAFVGVRSLEGSVRVNFGQRVTGSFSPDGGTLRGAGEKAESGSEWTHGFDLSALRLG